jgi:hypothetical protein
MMQRFLASQIAADSIGAISRRRLLKGAAGLAIAAAPLVRIEQDASAARTWCRKDPLYLIGNRIVDVSLAADARILSSTTGPVEIKIVVPRRTPVAEVFSDNGFGYGYRLTVVESSDLRASLLKMPYRVHVYVPSKTGGLEVAVYVTTVGTALDGVTTLRVSDLLSLQDTAWGVVNQWVKYSGNLTLI